MKVAGVFELDPAASAAGLPSRAFGSVAGAPALARALDRALRAERLSGLAVATTPGAAPRVREVAGERPVEILEVLGADLPARARLRRGRKWGLESWRNTLGFGYVFDEALDAKALVAAAEKLGAHAVCVLRPEAALLDPALLDATIEYFEARDLRRHPFVYTQAPAGLAGEVYLLPFLRGLAEAGRTVGELLVPASGQATQDPAHRENSFLVPEPVRRLGLRLAADTRRGAGLCERLLERNGGEAPDAARIAALVAAEPGLRLGAVPRFVEIELTAEGAPRSRLGPYAGGSAPGRVLDADTFERVLDALGACDDVCLTLGGLGDPLLHPELPAFIDRARAAGVYGLAVDTPGFALDEATARALAERDLDVVAVSLLANTAATYEAVTGRRDFERLAGAVEALLAARGADWERPYVACEIEKNEPAEGEIVDFFDRWEKAGASPVIRPFNDFAGQVPDRSVLRLTLAQRGPCVKLEREMLVLADGTVPVCRQDFAARCPAGDARATPLGELWRGERLATVRAAHRAGDWGAFPLCARCWHWDCL